MPLTSGSQIGPYQIVSPLGVGGMGEVYRANDARLRREVAIKVVPESTANDPDRLARFAREAQFLAALNHPNIGSIYGFEESSSMLALVMELVEGPTLADRITQGPVPLNDALPIMRQICEALEYAHDRGIVHRDLKPANIKIKPDGTVKVLDFGLAKVAPTSSGSGERSPTFTIGMTEAGMILGTASYMAPEQARGKTTDKRADIFAFGVVLHEMITGKRLFGGEDAGEMLAKVIRDEPDLSDAPPSIHRLLSECLQKDPRKRLRDIGDVWRLLDGVPASSGPANGPPA